MLEVAAGNVNADSGVTWYRIAFGSAASGRNGKNGKTIKPAWAGVGEW